MNKRTRWTAVGLLILLLLLATVLINHEFERAQFAYNNDNLIRFHVLANSDSAEDQALKERVRAVLAEGIGGYFDGVNTVEEARKLITDHLQEIEAMARDKVRADGYDYPVTAQLGRFPFPAKNYGAIVLPSGEYEALRVVIGQGRGQNWWCILFPPLCFIDENSAIAKEEGRPIEIRFRILEIFDSLKNFFSEHKQESNVPARS